MADSKVTSLSAVTPALADLYYAYVGKAAGNLDKKVLIGSAAGHDHTEYALAGDTGDAVLLSLIYEPEDTDDDINLDNAATAFTYFIAANGFNHLQLPSPHNWIGQRLSIVGDCDVDNRLLFDDVGGGFLKNTDGSNITTLLMDDSQFLVLEAYDTNSWRVVRATSGITVPELV